MMNRRKFLRGTAMVSAVVALPAIAMSAPVSEPVWHHIAIVRDLASTRWYVDGELERVKVMPWTPDDLEPMTMQGWFHRDSSMYHAFLGYDG